jgi:hypothetical protein
MKIPSRMRAPFLLRKKPGYPLQLLESAFGAFCGVSAPIPCAPRAFRASRGITLYSESKSRPVAFSSGGASRRRGRAKLPKAILPRFGCPHALGARQGLQWKARRICIGKSEDLERKARFFQCARFARTGKRRLREKSWAG